MFEQRMGSDSVLGSNMLGECLKNIKTGHNEEINQFIKDKKNKTEDTQPLDKKRNKQIEIQTVSNILTSLDDDSYDRYANNK